MLFKCVLRCILERIYMFSILYNDLWILLWWWWWAIYGVWPTVIRSATNWPIEKWHNWQGLWYSLRHIKTLRVRRDTSWFRDTMLHHISELKLTWKMGLNLLSYIHISIYTYSPDLVTATVKSELILWWVHLFDLCFAGYVFLFAKLYS